MPSEQLKRNTMTKGKYKTIHGASVEVLDFDEANLIVYVRFDDGVCRWAAQAEYSEWESLDVSPTTTTTEQTETIIIEVVAEPIEIKDEDVAEVEAVKEKPKKKTTTTKKKAK
jgi:hypothetical protein